MVGDHYTHAGSTVIITGILHKYIPSRHVVDDEGFLGGGGATNFLAVDYLDMHVDIHAHVQPNLGEIVLHVNVHVHVHACVLYKTLPYIHVP